MPNPTTPAAPALAAPRPCFGSRLIGQLSLADIKSSLARRRFDVVWSFGIDSDNLATVGIPPATDDFAANYSRSWIRILDGEVALAEDGRLVLEDPLAAPNITEPALNPAWLWIVAQVS